MNVHPLRASRFARPAAAVAVLLTAAASVTISPAASFGAKSNRSAVVTPSTNLTNQVVTVSWSGFHPTAKNGNFKVQVYQCKSNPRSLSDCFTVAPFPNSANGNSVVGTTSKDKTGSAQIEIRSANLLPELDCRQQNACSLLVWEMNGTAPPDTGLPKNSVVVPITFAKSQADCPIPNGFDLRAEGEASAAPSFYQWAAQLCEGDGALALDYTETSSNGGRDSFLHDQVDLGLTSLPATSDELAAAGTQSPFAYAPLGIDAVGIGYNITDSTTGKPITDLVLSPRLVARAITDTRIGEFFSDPELRALNPGHTFPGGGLAQPLLRAERNADTQLLTEWIVADADARAFIAGNDRFGISVVNAFKNYPYPTDIFENAAGDDAFVPRSGEYEVANRIFHGVKPTDSAPSLGYGYLGVIDRTAATNFAVPLARLVTSTGSKVAPDDTALRAGLAAMTTSNGVLRANFATTDPAAYPLVKIDHVMVRLQPTTTDGNGATVADTAKRDRLKQFLTWAVTTGQQHLPDGTLPLTDALIAETKAVADRITTWSAPPTTTTTTVPATTTTVGTTTTTDGSTTDFGGPTDFGGGGGSFGGDSSGGATDFGTTTPTYGDGTPIASGKGNERPLARAASAPTWLPIASIGPSAVRYAFPGLLIAGLLAGLVRLLMLAGPRLATWRASVLTKGNA